MFGISSFLIFLLKMFKNWQVYIDIYIYLYIYIYIYIYLYIYIFIYIYIYLLIYLYLYFDSSFKFTYSEDVLIFIISCSTVHHFILIFIRYYLKIPNIMSVFAKYENRLSIIGGLRPLIIFKIPVIKTCKFFWCTVICLFNVNKSLKLHQHLRSI